MSLVFKLAHPSAADVDLGNAVVRLDTLTLSDAAETGDAAASGIRFDDPAGTLDIPGFWQLRVYETALPSNTCIWAGYVTERTIERGGDSFLTGAARRWTADLLDLNACLGFPILTDATANRPAETAEARFNWLVAHPKSPVVAAALSCVTTASMDANDYRGQTFRDVLADIAAVTKFTFHCRFRESDGAIELLFYNPDDVVWGSPIRISNDTADIDQVFTFPPTEEATLRRSPSRVASGVYLPYAGGEAVYLSAGAVASNFTLRDLPAPMANVHTVSQATAVASNFLVASSTEEDRLAVAVRLPRARLSELLVGQRMYVRFTHLPGWTTWRSVRVVRRTLIQDAGTIETFVLRLECVPVDDGASAYVQAQLYAPANAVIGGPGEVTPVVYFRGDGDSPPAGRTPYATTGPVTLVTYPFGSGNYAGIRVNGDGRVSLYLEASAASVIDAGVHSASFSILRNGTNVQTWSVATNSSGAAFWGAGIAETITDVCCESGDEFTVTAQIGGGHSTTVPTGVGTLTDGLRLWGTVRT